MNDAATETRLDRLPTMVVSRDEEQIPGDISEQELSGTEKQTLADYDHLLEKLVIDFFGQQIFEVLRSRETSGEPLDTDEKLAAVVAQETLETMTLGLKKLHDDIQKTNDQTLNETLKLKLGLLKNKIDSFLQQIGQKLDIIQRFNLSDVELEDVSWYRQRHQNEVELHRKLLDQYYELPILSTYVSPSGDTIAREEDKFKNPFTAPTLLYKDKDVMRASRLEPIGTVYSESQEALFARDKMLTFLKETVANKLGISVYDLRRMPRQERHQLKQELKKNNPKEWRALNEREQTLEYQSIDAYQQLQIELKRVSGGKNTLQSFAKLEYMILENEPNHNQQEALSIIALAEFAKRRGWLPYELSLVNKVVDQQQLLPLIGAIDQAYAQMLAGDQDHRLEDGLRYFFHAHQEDFTLYITSLFKTTQEKPLYGDEPISRASSWGRALVDRFLPKKYNFRKYRHAIAY